MILYAAIDLLDGRCLRAQRNGDGRLGMVEEDALAVARRWQEAGARWLHVVDLDGARTGQPAHGALVREIADATGLPIQFAGGLRSEQDVEAIFTQGAMRTILDTTAAHDVALLGACLARWDGRIAVSLEARGDAVTVAGWLASASETIAEFAQRIVEAGVRTLLMTDMEKDGSVAHGVSERLLRLRAALPGVVLIAAGNIMTVDEVRHLALAGLDGAVLGRALYENEFDLAEALRVASDPAANPSPRLTPSSGEQQAEEHVSPTDREEPPKGPTVIVSPAMDEERPPESPPDTAQRRDEDQVENSSPGSEGAGE